MNIQVTDPVEIAAVISREIEGDTYNDGSVFAEEKSLLRWRDRPQNLPVEGESREQLA